MKHFKKAASKLSLRHADKFKPLVDESEVIGNDEDLASVWTTGQEFQFYVPWLWEDSSEPPPADKLHPNRKVVRIPRHPNPLECTTESLDAWIQHSVTSAVKDLVHDDEHYPTRTERQLEELQYDRTKAWKDFNIVQRKCNLPEGNRPPGYDGVLPIEMTIIIRQVSIRPVQGSSCLEWHNLPSPGKCIERIKNQIRIYLTPECSLHIHIRPDDILDFTLLSFKKMASLLWLAEGRLNKLYHPARNNPDRPFHRSLRRHSNLALGEYALATGRLEDHATWLWPANLAIGEEGKLVTIWQTSDLYQLRELLRVHPSVGKHDRPAYNFFNVFMASDKQTIEFRKMEAIIDAQVIDAWIEVFLLLTDFCMTCSVEKFQTVMGNLGKPDDVNYTTWDLLRDIGCCKNPTVEVLKRKFMQQWLPAEPTSGPESRPASTTSSTGSTRSRLGNTIRNGAKKLGDKIAGGYRYGR